MTALFLVVFLLFGLVSIVLSQQVDEIRAFNLRLLDRLTRVELLERKTEDEDHA